METTIELRGFARLMNLFQERGWSFPYYYPLSAPLSGYELLEQLAINKDQVEALFINGRAQPLDAVINPGDRVALIPPGTPGPYRILLGIRST